MLTATTNAPYPNRLQLMLGDWIGPFIQPASPPVEFDPTNPKHLEVYVDGLPLAIINASYDPVNNRYLLFADKAFNLQGVIQLIHHMPRPPFQYGQGVFAPPSTFTVSIDPLHLPLTLQFYTDTNASPGWNDFNPPNSEAPVLSLATNSILFIGDNTLFMSGYNNPTPPPAGVADPDGVLSVDVSATTPLVNLDVDSFPNLTVLTLGSLPSLSEVYCYGNLSLTGVDTTGLPALSLFDCDSGGITSVDMSQNPQLSYFDCSSNSIPAIDVSHNPLLQTFNCFQQGSGPSWSLLTALDVTHNPALVSFAFFNTSVVSIDLSSNPLLQDLNCFGCQLTALDVTHNPALVSLSCFSNPFAGSPPTLDTSANPNLRLLNCSSCNLASLDLSSNPLLAAVECGSNISETYALSSLDISNNPAIVHVFNHLRAGHRW